MSLDIQVAPVFIPLTQKMRYKGAFGGRACVHPDTMIETPTGATRIGDFEGGLILSWDGEKTVEAYAGPTVRYLPTELFEAELSNGASVVCTKNHRWLTPSGWHNLPTVDAELLLSKPCLPQSNLDTSLSGSLSGVHHCLRTLLGFLWCYLEDYRLCDERLPSAAKTYLDALQQLICEPKRNRRVSTCLDATDNACRRTHLQFSLHLSNLASHFQSEGQSCAGQENCISETSSGLLSASYRLSELSRQNKPPHEQAIELAKALLYLDSLTNQVGSLQTVSDILRRDVDDSSFSDSFSCSLDPHTVSLRVVSVKYVGDGEYCDIFVPIFNNYIAAGAVHHNSAKSHFFADQVILKSMQEKCDIICLRETQMSLQQSVKKLIEQKIEAFGLGKFFTVLQTHIESFRGGRIGFQGMQNHTADSIKSLQGYKYAWVEEAQNFSQRSLDLLRPTIRELDSEIWFSWNPDTEADPVDVFLRQNPPEKSIVVRANYTENPWLPEVMKDEIEYDKRRDPDKYAHVWLGEYQSNSEARVFKNWKVEEFERPEGTVHRLGADWGYSVDPSCLVRCSIEGNKLYFDYEAYMVGCEIVNLPDLFRRVPESEKWFITADSARPETIAYMRTHGFPKINSAIKGKKSIEEGVAFMQSFDIVIHPRCKHLIDEMTLFSYKSDKLTGVILPILEDKHNHLIDSARYSLEGARRAIKKIVEPKEKKLYGYGFNNWMNA